MRPRPLPAALLVVIVAIYLPWTAMLSLAMAGPTGVLEITFEPSVAGDCAGCMGKATDKAECAAVFCAGLVAVLAETAGDALACEDELRARRGSRHPSPTLDLEPPPPRRTSSS